VAQEIAILLSGALGALLIRSGIKLAIKLLAERKPLAEYDCGNENTGPGCLRKSWGKRISDPKATNNQAWTYSNDRIEPRREHTIYGPYTNDFGKPGSYKVIFRIRCLNHFDWSSKSPPSPNDTVIVLDVVQTPFSKQQGMVMTGQRMIRAQELKPTYKNFVVNCYYAGGGIYEYRCSVMRDKLPKSDNTFLFDNIKVYRQLSAW
jgi:hypothetical protein